MDDETYTRLGKLQEQIDALQGIASLFGMTLAGFSLFFIL